MRLGEIYPRFVTDYGETCYGWTSYLGVATSCTLASAKARSERTKAQIAGYYFREWRFN
jgi:hypothetical protein